MPEKRSFIRYALEGNTCWKLEADPSKVLEGKLLDVSFTGLSAFFKESVEVNTIVWFDASANVIEQHLIGRGKVVYLKKQKLYADDGFRMGLEFIEFNKGLIIGLINRLQAKICEEARMRWQSLPKDVGPI